MHLVEADAADAEASLNAFLTDERQSYASWTTYESGYAASDSEKLAAYAKLALPGVAPFGARVLARGDAAVAREHGLKERTVVVEYPSLETATAAYGSPAYAEALKALGDRAVRDFRIVEGIE